MTIVMTGEDFLLEPATVSGNGVELLPLLPVSVLSSGECLCVDECVEEVVAAVEDVEDEGKAVEGA